MASCNKPKTGLQSFYRSAQPSVTTRAYSTLKAGLGKHMAQFQIYSGSTLVGWSALEDGDPPMGVASGELEPAEGYRFIANECRSNYGDQSFLKLTVQTSNGVTIPCAGVCISDCSQVLSGGCVEISILGIPYPLYQELFPRHVETYARQFD